MPSETFKEQLTLIFLNKYIEDEGVYSSDTDDDDIIDNANQVANAIYLYVNAILAAHEGAKLEIREQPTAVPKPVGTGLLGLK